MCCIIDGVYLDICVIFSIFSMFSVFSQFQSPNKFGMGPLILLLWFYDTKNTFYLIVKGLKAAFFMPFFVINEHLEGPASCKWSSWGTGLSQMIIWINQPPANDHPKGRPLANDHPFQPDSSPFFFLFFGEFIFFLRQTSSSPSKHFAFRFNLADLSRTMCSRFTGWPPQVSSFLVSGFTS